MAAQRVHHLKTLSAIMCFWAWKWGTKAWKNVIFKNNPFPLNNAISKLFPVYSAREISDARAFVTGFKGVSNRRGNLHPQKTSANFQSLVISLPAFRNYWAGLCAIFLSWYLKYNRVNQTLCMSTINQVVYLTCNKGKISQKPPESTKDRKKEKERD